MYQPPPIDDDSDDKGYDCVQVELGEHAYVAAMSYIAHAH
jgi:hypothetical protein